MRTDYQALGTVLKVGDAELEISDLSYRVPSRAPVVLTPTELRLLECLTRNHGIGMRQETLTERTGLRRLRGEQSRRGLHPAAA